MRTSPIIAYGIALAVGTIPSMAATVLLKRDTPQCNKANNQIICADATAACAQIPAKKFGFGSQLTLGVAGTAVIVVNNMFAINRPSSAQLFDDCNSIVSTCCPEGGNTTKATVSFDGKSDSHNIQVIAPKDQ